MKKIVIFLIVLFSAISNAQNLDYLQLLKKLPSPEAVVNATNEILAVSNGKLRFYKSKDFQDLSMFVVQYVPAHLNDEEIQAKKDELADQFVIFQFKYWNEGQDKNLGIEGVRKYVFSDVRGTYADLFPFWQKNVDPLADKLQLSKKGSASKNGYYFSGSGGQWRIR